MLGSREIYVWAAKCESARRTLSVVSFQIRLKCALLVCLSLLLETKEEFRTAIENKKKNAGCGIFYKNFCSNRRSKSRMESDNLEEPLVFNYTIASSYHLGDLFLYFFFFFFYRKRALMLSTFKLCRGDLRRCASGWLKISAREL